MSQRIPNHFCSNLRYSHIIFSIELVNPDLWLLHARHQVFPLLFLFRGLFFFSLWREYELLKLCTYLSFMFIDLVLLAREASHGNHEVSERLLETLPLLKVVEKLID